MAGSLLTAAGLRSRSAGCDSLRAAGCSMSPCSSSRTPAWSYQPDSAALDSTHPPAAVASSECSPSLELSSESQSKNSETRRKRKKEQNKESQHFFPFIMASKKIEALANELLLVMLKLVKSQCEGCRDEPDNLKL